MALKNLKKLDNYITYKEMMYQLYETQYSIYDHLRTNNPLSSVLFHESENYIKDFLYETYLRTYLYKELHSKLGMSFDEFLDHPRYQIESMIQIVNEVDQRKIKTNESFFKELEKKPQAEFKDLLDNESK